MNHPHSHHARIWRRARYWRANVAAHPWTIAMITATSLSVGSVNAEASAGLRPVSSCGHLRYQLAQLIADQILYGSPYGYGVRTRTALPASRARGEAGAPLGGAFDDRKGGGPSHTTTNNQVAGVEESDIVQTDGRTIYTVRGSQVLIVNSWPARSTSIVGRYTVPGGATPTQLLLRGRTLVVLSRAHQRPKGRPYYGRRHRPYGYRPANTFVGTRVTVLDVSRRSAPRALRHVEIEGALLQTRMIDGDVYLVQNGTLAVPPSVWSQARAGFSGPNHWRLRPAQRRLMLASARPMIRERVLTALRGVAIDRLLPRVRTYDGAGRPTGQRRLYGCRDLRLPAQPGPLGLLSVARLSLGDHSTVGAGIVGSGFKVYASRQSLYVAGASNHFWGWRAPPQTQIHKFALDGADGVRYLASGAVPGWLLNQFSLDEHRGYLRVATTDQSTGGNGLFVLRQRGGELAVAGAVRGLARGERIYATRMMGDVAYVVTFRRTDPLYTIDLSNPTRPRVVGELKINGFSSYIHPLGKGYLLTIGQDADDNGRVRGVHLQVFDVRDASRPQRVQHQRLATGGSSWSAAQNDHHAFTYDPRGKVLAFPLTINGTERFNGLALFEVDVERGLRPLGRIAHDDLAAAATRRRCRPHDGSRCGPTHPTAYPVQLQRSLFIEDRVYSFSHLGLKVNSLYRPQFQLASLLYDA